MNRRLLIIVLMACLLPLGMQAQQGTFRFAQLTDIHLTPNNPNPTEDLLRSIAQINATDSIDFVLVTGDLTETKVHVHTNHPGLAFEKALAAAPLSEKSLAANASSSSTRDSFSSVSTPVR